MDSLGIEFIALSAWSSSVFRVEHYADDIAFDSFKSWIVPADFPRNTFPSGRAAEHYKIFDEPVFEYSWFVCQGFAAASLTLDKDLTLVEVKTLRFRAQAAKIDLAVNSPAGECGKTVYSTSQDASESLKKLEVAETSTIFDAAVYPNPAHQTEVRNWQAQFKPERAETTVTELSNCIEMNFISQNYYHWTAQALISINLCAEIHNQLNPGSMVTIVTGRLASFQKQFLEILLKEYPQTNIIELGKHEFITSETVLYCNALGPLYATSRIVLEQIFFGGKDH